MMNNKPYFYILKEAIDDHNQREWVKAETNKTKPRLLPKLVGVDEVLEEPVNNQIIHLKVKAVYRPYYSKRDPGSRKALHRFELGRARAGLVIIDIFSTGKYSINFPDLRLEVKS
jgi:hypothetical protein